MNLLENKQIHKGDNRSVNAFHSDNRKYIFIYSIELYGIFDSNLFCGYVMYDVACAIFMHYTSFMHHMR